ncbi:MAG: ABC transporter ATP-binding protein [Eggerthellaceae bacterium]|nr:ABC transporter ATP-binding protein [Eggerthellaceae bacterium]
MSSEGAKRPHRGAGQGPHGPGMHGGERARDFSGTMRKMLSFMGQFKLHIILVLIFAIGSTVFNIVGPKVLSEATTALFEGVIAQIGGTGGIDFDLVARILITTLILYLVSAACSWIQSWTMSYVSQETCYRLRDAIAKKIDRMPFGYFEKSSTGDTLSRITNDVDTLGQSLNQGVTQLITSTVTVIGVIVMMLSINWLLTLITLVMVPLSLILVSVVVKASQKHFYAQQALLGQVNAQTEETFSGHQIVKAFGREDETVRMFNEANDALYEAGWKSQFLSGLMKPVMDLIGNLGYVAVAITGAFLAVQGTITVGDIQAFIQYVKNFTQPITQLAQVSNVLQQLAAAAERIFDFLDQPEMEPEAKTHEANGLECDVVFDDVEFGYDPDKPVLKDLDERVSEGQTVAIVGPTGAGKTTIVKLLMRFYEPTSGHISIGGVDISTLSKDDERSLFAMVLQDAWLFSGTIRENIRYGRLDATDEEVEAAAKRAYADHFITTLPSGYEFRLNEDASNISAGQKQLLTIARAILADRRMLILDEATSSVDTRTEAKIQEAMDNLMEGRTSFVIAHRLSTIRNADVILVMDAGRVIESGTHEQLLARGGRYAELYNSQFDAEPEDDRQGDDVHMT